MGPCSWPVGSRIRKRADYLRCYQYGKKHHTRHFILFARLVPSQPQRFGIAVSRKVGCAVVRNRIKRLLREIFRQQKATVPGLELVAVAKKEAAGVDFWQAQAEISTFMAQLASRVPSS